MPSNSQFHVPDCYINEQKHHHISILSFTEKEYDLWIAEQDSYIAKQLNLCGFSARPGEIALLHTNDGDTDTIVAGLNTNATIYEYAAIPTFIQKSLSKEIIAETSFSFGLIASKSNQNEKAILGWGLGCYSFNSYKAQNTETPLLLMDTDSLEGESRVKFDSICMLRNLVNTPANDLGPAELEDVTNDLAAQYGAKIKVTKGKSLEKSFPLVHAVGQAASKERAPRMIELTWGNSTSPKLTLVGKGVCFDTGGLDLKPSPHMGLMKKDMGGAAHALALAKLIMSTRVEVYLRVLIPAVENSVSANSFRPGDVFTSRLGLTVENTDTDAEGRLILADALCYASEGNPDLIIDFATLTGSARAGLGQDIPAVFTNEPELEHHIRSHGKCKEDPIWLMPLHGDYKSILDSDIADIKNHAALPGDLIYSALFLEQFVTNKTRTPRWIHIDCFAWESIGRPGRSKGGKDTGLRSAFSIVKKIFG